MGVMHCQSQVVWDSRTDQGHPVVFLGLAWLPF